MKWPCHWLAVLLIATAPVASAQPPTRGTPAASPVAPTAAEVKLPVLQTFIDRFGSEGEDADDLIGDVRDNLVSEVLLRDAPAARAEIGRIVAFSRADVQTGAGSSASGSTSAVVSPLLPAIFGAAFENGAITRTVSGSTITLKANPAGLICAGRAQGVEAVALRDPAACNRVWARLGITASFDTSRGEKQASLANLATVQSQFSELAVRYELVNHRDVSLDDLKGSVDTLRTRSAAFATALEAARGALAPFTDELVARFEKRDKAAFAASSPAEQRALVAGLVRDILARASLEPTLAARLRTLWLEALVAYERVEADVAGALVVTLDYTLQRPDLAAEDLAGGIVAKGERPPDVHAVRLVAAKAPLPNLDVTVNGAVAFFGDTRPGMRGHFRDARVGVEGKWKLRSLKGYGRPTLSFAALYTFLNQSPLGLGVAVNGVGVAERGHIWVVQTKFELPTANNSIRIPISVTYANRTELIKESDVRGQIGISFNLDSLFATP